MSERLIIEERAGCIASLTLNDPKRLNVLSVAMMSALSQHLSAIGDDPSVHVVILKANGRGFCAGHDLGDVQSDCDDTAAAQRTFEALFAQCTAMMQLIPQMPQPVIALVHGIATAAGCQLVASCDIALAEPDAKFGLNGIDVGLFCSTPMVAASRVMLAKTCFEMLVSGRFITAPEAQQAGLITRTVDTGTLLKEGQGLAAKIAEKQPSAIALGKAAFYRQLHMPVDEAYAIGQHTIVENLMLGPTQTKIQAFKSRNQQS